MYHKVAPLRPGAAVPAHYVEPKRFGRHLRLLSLLGRRPESLARALAQDATTAAAITFDDGYQNVAEFAAPALAAVGGRATVFAVSGRLGLTNTWDAEPDSAGAEPLLGPEAITDLHRAGWEIGSHTVSHPVLPELGGEELTFELRQSKADLEHLLGANVESFAYPYGMLNAAVVQAVREAGYVRAVTTVRGGAKPGDDPHCLPRLNVRRHTGVFRLATKLWSARRG
jgi:peptidoglycan/xylan/chitin deacetylase (PgdA/CDA1 family)